MALTSSFIRTYAATIKCTKNTWSDAVSFSTGTGIDTDTSIAGVYGQIEAVTDTVNRSFFTFDISSIPPGSKVSSSRIRLKWGETRTDWLAYIFVVNSNHGAGAISIDDYNDIGSTKYTDGVAANALPLDGSYGYFTFNSTGIAAVQSVIDAQSGNFYTGMRINRDIVNSQPPYGYGGIKEIRNSDGAGDIILDVTYIPFINRSAYLFG
jgi:hypothetical protein